MGTIAENLTLLESLRDDLEGNLTTMGLSPAQGAPLIDLVPEVLNIPQGGEADGANIISAAIVQSSPQVDDTLTLDINASGDPTPTLSYQWRRGGEGISGATSATYQLVTADIGTDTVDCVVSATNTISGQTFVATRITAAVSVAAADTAPEAFTVGQWDVSAGQITISALPADGGSAITDIEYRLNGGSPVSLGETTTGTYAHVGEEDDDIQLRAVNAIGAGAWSDTKQVPAAAEPLEVTAITDRVEVIDLDGTATGTIQQPEDGFATVDLDGNVVFVSLEDSA